MPGPHTIPELFRFQAGWCGKLGSPLYEYLLNRCSDDYEQGGPLRDLLEPHRDDPRGSVLALRLMGAVHRLVLLGEAPQLATFYPSVGGTVVFDGVWDAFVGALQQQRQFLEQQIRRPVQTNEVGRCGALLGGFLLVAGHTKLPLRLLEIGASAGLNLRWDHFRYNWNGGGWGDPASPVVLHDVFTQGGCPPLQEVRVAERRGCDPSPLDPASSEGHLTLLAFIWPEQHERRRLLEAAVQVARAVPCVLDCARAAEWLESHLSTPVPGQATVLFHSIVWQYMSREERQRVSDLIEDAGSRASANAPLAWLRMEPGEASAEVRLRIFPGFGDRLLAVAGFHEPRATWLADTIQE